MSSADLHARFAPSSAHRWIECPGSVTAQEEYPDHGNIFAWEGTFAHEIASHCLEEGLDAIEMVDIVGAVHKEHGSVTFAKRKAKAIVEDFLASPDFEVFTFSADDVEPMQVYLDYCRDLILLADRFEIEQRVHIAADLWGTSDLILYHPFDLHVVDLKWGRGVRVNADDNEQAKVYALGALARWPDGDLPLRIHLHIVQPRVHQGVTNYALETRELLAWQRETIEPAMQDALSADPTFHAGEHCKFCRAAGDCATLREHSMAVARTIFQPVPQKPQLPTDPAKVGEILQKLPMLEEWISSVRKTAEQMAFRGTEIPGFKVVNTESNRQWRDEKAAEALLREHGCSPHAKPKVLTPAQAEKSLGPRLKKLVQPLTVRRVTGKKLVPASDRRPAVSSFDAIDS